MSEQGSPSAGPRTVAADSTHVAVAAGPLAGPVLARVVGIGASRADLPVDRLDDALLLADVIAAHAPSLVPEGRIELTSRSLDGRLELRLGPLRAGGAEKLLDETSGPGVGNIIMRLASATSVVEQQGGDTLVIEIAA
jgi:serine/threonine-protein kinase RsbW